MLSKDRVDLILAALGDWTRLRSDLSAAALVGSWARGEASPGSDLDALILTADRDRFQSSTAWVEEIDWHRAQSKVVGWQDRRYGLVWSRHLRLDPAGEVEMTFALPSWADRDPIDPGTRRVVRDGLKVLSDRADLFGRLLEPDRVTPKRCDPIRL